MPLPLKFFTSTKIVVQLYLPLIKNITFYIIWLLNSVSSSVFSS